MKTIFKTIIFVIVAIFSSLFMITQSFSVTAYAETTTAKNDRNLVTTYQAENGVIMAPTVVVEVTSNEVLENALSAEAKPSNVILRIDDKLNVVSDGGATISTFKEVFTRLDKKIIPVVRIETEGECQALLDYLLQDTYVLDMAVMSSDPELIGKIKTERPSVRGIVYFDGSVSKEDMVSKSTLNGALGIVLDEGSVSKEVISYIQGRFKTVWIRSLSDSKTDLLSAVATGAYGVICENAKNLYDLYKSLPENSYVRTPFIVGHRGDYAHYNSNSLSGIKAAAEGGATHVELDFHVTKDKEIVCMHDDTIKTTTTYTGSKTIKQMTLSEIKKYKINDVSEPEEIPTLEECAEAILETDLLLVLELKCNDKDLVEIIAKKLTEDEDLAPILDRLTFIVFESDEHQLQYVQQYLPKVPSANLNDAKQSSLKTVLEWMGKYNTGLDPSSGNITDSFNLDLKDRGIIPWTWTYGTYKDVLSAQKRGLIGLTTNDPTSYRDEVKYVTAVQEKVGFSLSVGDEVEVKTVTYGGEALTDENGVASYTKGTVVAVEKHGFKYKAVASVKVGDYTYYTEAFTVTASTAFTLMIVGIAVGVLAVVGVGILVFIKVKRKA